MKNIELSEVQVEIIARLLIDHRKELKKTIDDVDKYYIPNLDPIVLEQKNILKKLWKKQLNETTQLINQLK